MDEALFRHAWNEISYAKDAIENAARAFQRCGDDSSKPHVIMKARVFLDSPGNWCCMFGECLATSPAGFGNSPARACADFDRRWLWSHAEIDAADNGNQ